MLQPLEESQEEEVQEEHRKQTVVMMISVMKLRKMKKTVTAAQASVTKHSIHGCSLKGKNEV